MDATEGDVGVEREEERGEGIVERLSGGGQRVEEEKVVEVVEEEVVKVVEEVVVGERVEGREEVTKEERVDRESDKVELVKVVELVELVELVEGRDSGERVEMEEEGLGEGVKEAEEGVKDEHEEGVKEAGEAVKEAGEGVKEAEEAVKEIREGVKETGEGVKDEQDEGVNEAEEGVKEAEEAVKETGEAVKETEEGVKETGEAVKETREAVKETREGVKETGEAVKDEQEEAVKETREGMKETGEGVKEAVKEAREGVKETEEAVKEAVTDEQEEGLVCGVVAASISRAARTVTTETRLQRSHAADIAWVSCAQFTAEVGRGQIEEFLTTWRRSPLWLHCTEFVGEERCAWGRRCRYRVTWSLPTAHAPIPSASAQTHFTLLVASGRPPDSPVEVSFTFEGSGLVHRPGISVFRERWLSDILESKRLLLETRCLTATPPTTTIAATTTTTAATITAAAATTAATIHC
ncbi:A-kinase anchor protein 14 isoform X2 [Lethenteron reissneri]|nr:A-kinase anchor protein 14 isoform X2 [Lethenteron reissneri]